MAKKQPKKFEDFGEYIPGAKKDLYKLQLEYKKSDLLRLSLSKVYPRPDFAKMVSEGQISREVAIYCRALYDVIPPVPSQTWGEELRTSWAECAQEYIDEIIDVIKNKKDVPEELEEEVSIYMQILQHANYPDEEWRSGSYRVTYNLQKKKYLVRFSQDEAYWSPSIAVCVEDIKDHFEKPAQSTLNFKISKDSSGSGFCVFACIRPHAAVEHFATWEQAEKAVEEYTSLCNRYKELSRKPQLRYTENRIRNGPPHREVEITPDVFHGMFPFRGVQFGNNMSTPDRIKSLNEMWDALHDLALACEITPAQITHDKNLSLAFASRGRSDSAAHYENKERIINLTKKGGAGCLAHEWAHSLDHAINSFDSMLASEEGETENQVIINLWNVVETAYKLDVKKRCEAADAWRSDRRYYTKYLEMFARIFEIYILIRLHNLGIVNDYLVNVIPFSDFARSDIYIYPRISEMEVLVPHVDSFLNSYFGGTRVTTVPKDENFWRQ